MAKSIIGVVTSDKPDKTIIISVQTKKMNKLYKRQYLSTKKFSVHDEKNEAKIGDTVSIVASRPYSAHKHHALKQVISRAVLQKDDIAPIAEEVVEEEKT
ncbi:MAG: 30S ribosomal protein S17 [Candidatus Saccharimonadales bacterium]|jgi:small subunit ribosomal protein S17